MKYRLSVPLAFSLVLLAASAAEGQQLFSNFPVNGLISAFQVNGGSSFSDSFTLSASSTVGGIVIGAWLNPADTVTSVTWSIGTAPFSASSGSGIAGATSSFNFTNADGFDVDTVTFAIPNLTLPAGTYYLTISAAVSAGANPVYWDINNGAGIDAWDSTLGNVSAAGVCYNSVGISGTCATSFQIMSATTAVTLAPSSLSFANQAVNTTSTAQAITFTNSGPNALTVNSIAVTGTNPGDFAQTNNCPISPATIAVNGFCTINVTFTPSAANARSAAITFTDGGNGSPQSVILSGTGLPTPSNVTLAPSSLSFANQTVSTTSGAQTFTVTNNGPSTLAISSIAVTGANPGDFAQTNNCAISPATIAVNAFCTVNVTFTPTVTNARSAAITITDNGNNSPQSVGVSGTGLALSNVTLAPSSLSFANQTVNTTSTAQTFTVTNGGPSLLTIGSIGVAGANPGDFAQTNNCPVSPATIAVNGFCTVNVTFTPLAASLRSASITITDNGNASPQSVGVSGTGIAVVTGPTTWPNGYNYQATFTVAAGQVPAAQTNFPALISGTFADFATTANGGRITNTCTQTVGNNATSVPCDLIFTSDAAGTMPLSWEFESWTAATGAVNVWVNAPNLANGTTIYAWYGQPAVTTLQTTPSATWGSNFMAVYHLKENPTGTAPQMNDSTANANNATMGGTVQANQQQPGEIGGSLSFTTKSGASLANPGNFSFERTDSFSISGWFNIASNSGGTLLSKFPAAETSGWLLVQEPGPYVGLWLSGAGGNSNAWAETPAMTTGTWHYVVATYSGTSTVAGMNIYVDGVNQSLTTLNNNLTTSIVTTAAPEINGRGGPSFGSSDSMDEIRITAKGVVLSPAWVTASFNNQSKPGTFFNAVTGLTNAAGGALLSPAPSTVAFANQTVNTTSASQGIILTNNGPGAATINSIAITGTNPGDFAQTNNCPISPATLAANGFCTINVTFTPTAANARSAAVSITGSGNSPSVSLSGTGLAAPSNVTLAPSSLSFANQTVNTTSSAQTFTVTNNGPSTLTISSIAVTGANPGDFAQTNNCAISPATIAVNGFCTVNVTFTPTAANARSASITITDNGNASPQSAGMSGTGLALSTVTLAPSSLSFANQTVNTTSTAQTFTVTNSGPSLLTIGSIGVAGANPGDFAQTNNCPVSPATIAVNGFCTVNVTFTPLAASLRSASITITDNGNASPQSVGVSGTGIAVVTGPTTWPNGYNYQATFTVAAGQVPAAQTNFPTLISGTFADFATTGSGGRITNTCTQTVGNNATSVPCDLIFTSDAAGSTLLSWEFESWTAATGAVNVWVNAPNLANGTTIYAWYGQPAVTTLQTTPSATWGSNFMAVYHLKENPTGTAPQMNDSTVNANNATMGGTVQANQQQPGEIGGSLSFTTKSGASVANPGNFSFERTDSFSISGWFNIASNSGGTLLSKFPAAETSGWLLVQEPGPYVGLWLSGAGGNSNAWAETPALTTGTWHYVVATYSGTSTVAGMNIYVDGVNQSLTTLNNNLTTSIVTTAAPEINGRGGPSFGSSDSMDEIRITAKGVVLSPAWVTTSFNNQSKPATFFSVVTGLTN